MNEHDMFFEETDRIKGNDFAGQDVCVLGGTGTIGTALITRLVELGAKRVRCVTNDEYSLWRTEKLFGEQSGTNPVRYILKDIRNKTAMREVLRGVDFLYLVAAYKHVQYVEYSPQEAIDVNIMGNSNVIEEAIANGRIQKVVNISTDKVCYPQSVYGYSKAIMEKVVQWASFYRPVGEQLTCFANTRFGNVVGSRGSVLEHWFDPATKFIGLRNPEHQRFFMHTHDAIDLVIKASLHMRGGETFIFKMPSVRMGDLAEVASELTGKPIRTLPELSGETVHQWLMTEEESVHRLERGAGYIIHRGNPVVAPCDYSTKSQKPLDHDKIVELLSEWTKR